MFDKQRMIQSYNWTSFSPEKRGEADFNYYTKLLSDDLETLGENQGNYARKFYDRVNLIVARQSRCASPMITGPANFNNRRNGKLWDSRDRALSDFEHWRKKYLKAVTRERTLSPEAEIDKTLEELERMEIKHDLYKRMNKIKDIEGKRAFAMENDFMKVFEYWGDRFNHTIPSFHLTNHNNKIKARKEKLEVMASRIETKSTFTEIIIPNGRIYLDNDRVIVAHETRPDRETLDKIKANGFKYSPKTTTWVRKHTENAIYSASKLAKELNK